MKEYLLEKSMTCTEKMRKILQKVDKKLENLKFYLASKKGYYIGIKWLTDEYIKEYSICYGEYDIYDMKLGDVIEYHDCNPDDEYDRFAVIDIIMLRDMRFGGLGCPLADLIPKRRLNDETKTIEEWTKRYNGGEQAKILRQLQEWGWEVTFEKEQPVLKRLSSLSLTHREIRLNRFHRATILHFNKKLIIFEIQLLEDKRFYTFTPNRVITWRYI